MSYLCYLCSSLPPVVCMRAHVLFMLFVFVFTSSCLYEGSCLMYVICVRLYLQLFVGGLLSYLRYVYKTNTNNIKKTSALIQTTGGKDKHK
jgi:hypothetical protein